MLNVMEFNSDRKRMSVILRDKNGVIKLYSKGADNVILARASSTDRKYADVTMEHLEAFAKDGFRTLVLAYRVIGEQEYKVCWKLVVDKTKKIIYRKPLTGGDRATIVDY